MDFLKINPLPILLKSDDQAVQFFTRRDLLGEGVGPVQELWQLPVARKILKKQSVDGFWPRPGKQTNNATNHNLIETWKQFRILVEKYEFSRENPQIEQGAEFIFSCQTADGDIRGMIGNQYAIYYTGAFMALLIKAGYGKDPRIEKGFQWLLGIRQEDGGWSVPMITHKFNRETQYRLTTESVDPVEPDRSKPFSHNATGMVLRAFAAHRQRRHSEGVQKAARLLKSRFFEKDAYTSYQAASYWVRFEFPFWWNNLVSALDALSLIGIPREDEQIQKALKWLVENQDEDGLWRVTYAKSEFRDTPKNREMKLWITLAICRIFKRLTT